MAYNCVVLIKQVPDTKKITIKAMNEDGTVNRSALPAIFNPEDLNALEMAMYIKDSFGGKVTVITMGLPAAASILRDSLYRGADDAILVTDRKCAASDTLATSYILSRAVKKLDYDLVLCGRQAIDGDTAQVGPQLAEKLGIPQITYTEALEKLDGEFITVKRNIGNGWQIVKTKLPAMLTVTAEANEPRVAAAKKMMKYKNALTENEVREKITSDNPDTAPPALDSLVQAKSAELQEKGLLIKQWDLDFLQADLQWCGRNGSPTKVHRIQSVVLTAKETKDVQSDRAASAGADIHLRKAVPPGAGLGGGSSDAAAVLFGLNALWKLGLAAAELSLLGAALGSDVPLFLGPPCCRVTGRGEIVEPADVPDFVAVLILLGVPCATGEVYRAYDASGAQIGPQPDRKMLAGLPPSRWRSLLRNDLAAAARSVCAELDSAWRRLAAEPAVPICMTGSGSAMFVLCDDEAQAAEVRRSLPADLRAGGVTVRRNPW